MIISQDGYSAEYYEKKNKITIMLPQTMGTLTNTMETVRSRKTRLNESDLGCRYQSRRKEIEHEHTD